MRFVSLRTIAFMVLAASTGSAAANPLDESVRSVLRIETVEGRAMARTGSDLLVGTLVASPLIVDALENDWRSFGVNASVLLLTTGAVTLSKVLIPRDRPYVQECATNSSYSPDCGSRDAQRSFFSGHTASAFTGAALICSGRPAWCTVSYGLATATGLLRVASDRHHMTDLIPGAAVGLAFGWFIPKWFGTKVRAFPHTDGRSFSARFQLRL